MLPKTTKYLSDMLDAVQAIDDQIRGLSQPDFLGKRGVRDAVLWNLCVVGEALGAMAKMDEATAQRITDWKKIVGLRNQLIHGYAVINHEITWDIVTNKVPILRRELEQLLAP